MDVIVDTNIIRQDFQLGSRKFLLLFDYLKKAGSGLILPKIVYDELADVYQRDLTDKLAKYERSETDLDKVLVGKSLIKLNIEVEKEVQSYLAFVRKRLKISEDEILPYKSHYLEDVVTRAIKRKRPCSDEGEEFRDALVWLTVLDAAVQSPQRMIVFISANTKQFATSDGQLHPDLSAEAEASNVVIKYYRDINNFIEDHAAKIDYVTREWLNETIPIETVNQHAIEFIEVSGEQRLLEWIGNRDKASTGIFQPLAAYMRLQNFFVYEMADGSLYIEITYDGYAEVEFEVEEDIEVATSFWSGDGDEDEDDLEEQQSDLEKDTDDDTDEDTDESDLYPLNQASPADDSDLNFPVVFQVETNAVMRTFTPKIQVVLGLKVVNKTHKVINSVRVDIYDLDVDDTLLSDVNQQRMFADAFGSTPANVRERLQKWMKKE